MKECFYESQVDESISTVIELRSFLFKRCYTFFIMSDRYYRQYSMTFMIQFVNRMLAY